MAKEFAKNFFFNSSADNLNISDSRSSVDCLI